MIALVVFSETEPQVGPEKGPEKWPEKWADTFFDQDEIQILESAIESGDQFPLEEVYRHRANKNKSDDDFGNYIEDLLSQPWVSLRIQKHASQWLKSRIKIEQYQKMESEAVQVIATYAYRLFQNDPQNTDFLLAGPNSQVRVKIFVLPAISELRSSGGIKVS